MLFIQIDLPPTAAAGIHVQYVKTCCKSAPILDSLGKALPISLTMKAPPARQPLASIIKVPPTGGTGDVAYKDLVCTETDQKNIAFIIQTMAENGKISLLFRKGELNRIGADINHVHPLKFLGTVFSNEKLKECMREIYKDYFKWNGFMDGLGPSLTNQANQGKLTQYLDDFAKEVGTTPKEIEGYLQSKDWENMVRYLMTH